MCFGAKSGQFGRFYVKTAFKRVAAVKLVHLYGKCPVTHDMSLIGLTGAVACTAGDWARLMLS